MSSSYDEIRTFSLFFINPDPMRYRLRDMRHRANLNCRAKVDLVRKIPVFEKELERTCIQELSDSYGNNRIFMKRDDCIPFS